MLTVTTAADSYDLTTLETVKEELGDTTGVTDTLLRRWITEESANVARYCGRVLARETVTETFDLPVVRRNLRLNRFPVASVTSVIEDADDALDAAYYETDAETGALFRLGGSAVRRDWTAARVVVVYTGGYALLGALPRPIESAVLRLITRRYTARGRDPYLRAMSAPGLGEQQFWIPSDGGPEMPPDIAGMLASYRDIFV